MKCDSFRRAAGKTWQEKAEDACTNCTKCKGNFPTNPDDETEAKAASKFEQIIERVHSYRQYRDSTREPLPTSKMSPVDYECLVYMDACYERAERRSRIMERLLLEQNVELSLQIIQMSVGGKKK